MEQDPLQELRTIRRNIERACKAKGQTYADYLSEAQGKYTERLIRRGPNPRLRAKAQKATDLGAVRGQT